MMPVPNKAQSKSVVDGSGTAATFPKTKLGEKDVVDEVPAKSSVPSKTLMSISSIVLVTASTERIRNPAAGLFGLRLAPSLSLMPIVLKSLDSSMACGTWKTNSVGVASIKAWPLMKMSEP